MSIYFYNPLEDIIKAAQKINPDAKAIIQLDPEYKKNNPDSEAYTLFPDDGTTPIIYINADITFPYIVELMAHELAHVLTPEDKDHGKEWKETFELIGELYEKIAKESVEIVGKML